MKRLDDRLTTLETLTASRATKATTAELERAMCRLFDALSYAFQEVNEGSYVRSTEYKAALIWVAKRTVSFEQLILALAVRIESGTMSAADHDALATLPADALKSAEMTGTDLIATIAKAYRSVNG